MTNKRKIINQIEYCVKLRKGEKFIPYEESLKETLERESEKTLLEDLEIAKKNFLDIDLWTEKSELEEWLNKL